MRCRQTGCGPKPKRRSRARIHTFIFTGFEIASLLGFLDHAESHSVLDTPARIRELAFDEYVDSDRVRHMTQLEQRRVSDVVENRRRFSHLQFRLSSRINRAGIE